MILKQANEKHWPRSTRLSVLAGGMITAAQGR